MRRSLITGIIIILSVFMFTLACSKKRSIPMSPVIADTPTPVDTATIGDTSTSTETIIPTVTFTATDVPVRNPGWIDDCEDIYGPNQNDFHTDGYSLNVGGYWITYDDNSDVNNGTSYVWPIAETYADRLSIAHTPFEMSSPGYNSSYAARITGFVTGCEGGPGDWWLDETCSLTGITTYWPIYESGAFRFGFFGMGIQLTPTAGQVGVAGALIDDPNDCQEVDISGYSGIRFWVKGDGQAWRFKIPYTDQVNCDYKSGTLAEKKAANYNESDDIGHTWTPPNGVWAQKDIMFNGTDMGFEGFGTCSAPGLDCTLNTILQHVKQLQFQTAGGSTAATLYPNTRELWIDDIELLP